MTVRRKKADDQSGVIDLIEWNRSLDCRKWDREQCERLLSANPSEIEIATSKGRVTIRSNQMYQHREFIKLPGIDSGRLEELRSVGVVAHVAAKTYLYEGRRIIALLMGNVAAIDRRERLLRGEP